MSERDCFPQWLKNRTAQRIGPPIDSAIPYPVYQQQPPIISADNPLSASLNISDAFFKSFAGTILLAAIPTTIIKVTPRDVYDTINVSGLDNNPVLVNNRGVPIFFSMDRPGRITNEVPFQGNPEICVCAANAFAIADVSSFPTCIAVPQVFNLGGGGHQVYSTFVFTTPKTNRPFYVWFGDGIQGTPTVAANFKITWYVQGR